MSKLSERLSNVVIETEPKLRAIDETAAADRPTRSLHNSDSARPLAIVPSAQPEIAEAAKPLAKRTISAGLHSGDVHPTSWGTDPDGQGWVEMEDKSVVHLDARRPRYIGPWSATVESTRASVHCPGAAPHHPDRVNRPTCGTLWNERAGFHGSTRLG